MSGVVGCFVEVRDNQCLEKSAAFPVMCRIRFGLAGVHFEDFQICVPVEEGYQPLVANVPLIVADKATGNGSDAGCLSGTRYVRRRKFAGHTPGNIKRCISPASTYSITLTSSTSSQDDGGSKRDLPPSRSPSPGRILGNSSSSGTKGAQDDGDTVDGNTAISNIERPLQGPPTTSNVRREPKVGISPQRPATIKSARKTTSSSEPSSVTPSPLLKQVRFSDMVEKRTIPSEVASDLSSNSSNDSYTDPPPLAEERLTNSKFQSWSPKRSFEVGGHDARSISSTSNGSEVDPGPDWVASATLMQGTNSLASDSGMSSPTSQSWAGGESDSNVDFDGQGREESRFYRQKALSSPSSRFARRHSKTRSKGSLPEPIFVVRSQKRDHLDGRKEKRSASAGVGQNSSQMKVPKSANSKNKQSSAIKGKYKAPAVTEDAKENEIELDGHLSGPFREV